MIDLQLREHLLSLDTFPAIYIDLAPQSDPLPRIVLRLMPGARREYHSLGATDLVFADVECTIQAVTIEACHAIYDALRQQLDMTRGEWAGTTIDCCRITPPYNRLNLPQFADEQGVSSLVCTVETAYRESSAVLS